MRRLFRFTLFAVVAALTVTVAPAHAGIPFTLNLGIAPNTGPGGTITMISSVDPCPSGGGIYDVSVGLAIITNATDADFIQTAPVNADSSWQLSTTVPVAAPLGDYTYYVQCRGLPIAAPIRAGGTPAAAVATTVLLASYKPAIFTVTAPATTTTTAAPTTTTTTAAPTTTTTTPPATITAVPTFMVAGDSCHVTATGFAPGANVDVTVHSTPLAIGIIVAGSNGDVSTDWTVPAGFALGSHTVELTGIGANGQQLVLDAEVTIGEAVTTTVPVTTGTLPVTGSSMSGPLSLAGVTLVALGAVTVVVTRRRRHS